MPQLFETFMLVAFGFSWPTNIVKSYQARTTQGKSLLFLILVLSGYYFGIASKIIGNNITYVCIFYIVNAIMVKIDILLYFRNRALDRQRGDKVLKDHH